MQIDDIKVKIKETFVLKKQQKKEEKYNCLEIPVMVSITGES